MFFYALVLCCSTNQVCVFTAFRGTGFAMQQNFTLKIKYNFNLKIKKLFKIFCIFCSVFPDYLKICLTPEHKISNYYTFNKRAWISELYL